MADRTSARIFGELFQWLADEAPDTISRERLVQYLWEKQKRYDFSPCQMECDPEALMKLGLARRGVDPEYPDEGEIVLYGPVQDRR